MNVQNTKQEQISRQLAKPITIGDRVDVSVKYIKNGVIKVGHGKKARFENTATESVKNISGTVVDFETVDGSLFYLLANKHESVPYEARIDFPIFKKLQNYGDYIVRAEWCTQYINDCGVNPFRESPRVEFYAQTIWQLIHHCRYDKSNNYSEPIYHIIDNNPEDRSIEKCTYGGVNFDPYVFDENGKKYYYQRGLVWDDVAKRLLIDSIYNGIEIGKFVFRHRSWESISKMAKDTGHGWDWDCVDGKQRLHAIIEFIQDKFADNYGNYFSDLSENSQRKFFDYNKFTFGQLTEQTTDKHTIEVFLTVNFTGVLMSAEHLEYVKSIRDKIN